MNPERFMCEAVHGCGAGYPTSIDEAFGRQPADEEDLLPFAAQVSVRAVLTAS